MEHNGLSSPTYSVEDLDFADEIVTLSSTHLQEDSGDLSMNAKTTGLNIKRNSKIMHVNAVTVQIKIYREPLDHVDQFTYVGSVISTDNSAQKHIKAKLNKARCAFSRTSGSLNNTASKPRCNVKSVLLYGAECWRIVTTDVNKLNAFHNSCLRKICYWPNKISNETRWRRDIVAAPCPTGGLRD